MKKALLFNAMLLLVFIFSTALVFAYETVIIKYPDGELWLRAFYRKYGDEALLQYLPKNETRENWTRSIFVHSYNESSYPVNVFIANNLALMEKANPTSRYKYLKLADNDAIATRCTENYKHIKAQCEFFRVTRAHNGIISLHYVNRDKFDFNKNYTQWYEIIKRAKYYNTYYRGDRTLDKSEYFEL